MGLGVEFTNCIYMKNYSNFNGHIQGRQKLIINDGVHKNSQCEVKCDIFE